MKLYISVDMEGLAGITNWKDETEDQVRFRKAMNEQVEWVLEGIAKSKRQQGDHPHLHCGFSRRRTEPFLRRAQREGLPRMARERQPAPAVHDAGDGRQL